VKSYFSINRLIFFFRTQEATIARKVFESFSELKKIQKDLNQESYQNAERKSFTFSNGLV